MDMRYRKTPFGFLMDMRRIMGRLQTTTGEWCKAFDAGDTAALESLGTILKESLVELSEASEKANADDWQKKT